MSPATAPARGAALGAKQVRTVGVNRAFSREEAIQHLLASADPKAQMALRPFVHGPDYDFIMAQLYLANPFLRLTDDEVQRLGDEPRAAAWRRLIELRHAASRPGAPRHVVFCMPKSGSSFVESAVRVALGTPAVSLTGFGLGRFASFHGMNSREQELDELALVKAITLNPNGFVGQCHTRGSKYLARQAELFGLTPIVTVRSVLDCIVSFDDMIMAGRAGKTDLVWTNDTQFSLPFDYDEREPEARYEILARSYGVWLIAFYLSWRRCERHGFMTPLTLRYERDILDKGRFVKALSTHLGLAAEPKARLAQYAETPDPARARLNVGVRGRGEKLPPSAKAFLRDYAAVFKDELTADEIEYLVG